MDLVPPSLSASVLCFISSLGPTQIGIPFLCSTMGMVRYPWMASPEASSPS
nr:hypothetical protein Q903MT_gene2668 [Picea sitchensis]